MKEYRPQTKTVAILERAWGHVESVPYRVSTRWLFYRLLQDGVYQKTTKERDDYHHKFLPMLSKARKRFYRDWRPDTLVDDTREEHRTAQGALNVEEWRESLFDFECCLDPWTRQERFGIIVFEADAMRSQFEYFALPTFSLWPFGGDPSIDYKWRLAKFIDQAAECYGKPITVFYFGDLDKKGIEIAENAFEDIGPWSQTDFEIVRGGLNPGDEKRYGIPENFERPGQYQWVALTHEAAGDIIARTLNGFYQPGLTKELEKEERQATEAYQEALAYLR